jgi:hypothetical protein
MPAMFDLYYLLVEQVFGSVLLSGAGIVIFLLVIGVLSRMSPLTMSMLIGFFIGVFAMGYVGDLAGILLFLGAGIYGITGLLRAIFRSIGT